ncbi:MAG: hypothetical protein ACRDSH_04580 [Pseudonocardiaceae bacterium]
MRAGTGAVLLALGIGLGSLGLGWFLWPPPDRGEFRVIRGTVTESVVCGPPTARDVVRIESPDGEEISAQLDGCGHRLGAELKVEVPDPMPAGEPLVTLAGTGVSTTSADGQRLGAAGVAVAGIAGALLAWRLRSGRRTPRRRVDS